MRLTEDQKSENRRVILRTAARMFRERGIEGTSVADLMREAGFTHGGFYNHFESKEALVAEACAEVMTRTADSSVAQFDADPAKAWRDHVEWYLSTAHRDGRSRGCLVGTLAGEVALQPACVQAPFAASTEQTVELFARHFSHLSRAAARREATAAWATMVGAMTLARSVAQSDPALSEEILAACRRKLLA